MIEIASYGREQKRHLHEVQQVWTRQASLMAESKDLVGGMQWKTIRGHEYLYRYAPDPKLKKKKSTSLGPRGPETETIYAHFVERRAAVKGELKVLGETAVMQSRVSKALRLGHATRKFAEGLTAIADAGLFDHLVLASEQAVWGYETLFLAYLPGQESEQATLLTLDDHVIDDLLQAGKEAWPGIVFRGGQQGGYSFSFDDLRYRLLTKETFLQSLEPISDDRQIQCIRDRLHNAPISTFSIDRSGQPFPMHVPDPVAFAMISVVTRQDDLGPVLAALASGTDFAFSDAELDAFPSVANELEGGSPRL